MAREDLHFRLRIPEELKKKVEAEAQANGRSMTAEIVARLEETFEGNQSLWDSVNRIDESVTEMKEQMTRIAKQVEALMGRPYDDPNEWRD